MQGAPGERIRVNNVLLQTSLYCKLFRVQTLYA
jgi:hypothetical protein